MSEPARNVRPREALQQRVAAAILEAAARVLSSEGERASMNDVAVAAGVARATLYRYFPNRQALLDALATSAVNEAAGRLVAARVHQLDATEGLWRAVRVLVEGGDPLVVIARERVLTDGDEFEQGVLRPLRAIFERGQRAGDIRDDIPSTWLTESLIALVSTVVGSRPALGREDTVAAIVSLFMEGARGRSSPRTSTTSPRRPGRARSATPHS